MELLDRRDTGETQERAGVESRKLDRRELDRSELDRRD
jgi:hypothetical protein